MLSAEIVSNGVGLAVWTWQLAGMFLNSTLTLRMAPYLRIKVSVGASFPIETRSQGQMNPLSKHTLTS
jgi:hypothetical protein